MLNTKAEEIFPILCQQWQQHFIAFMDNRQAFMKANMELLAWKFHGMVSSKHSATVRLDEICQKACM